MRIGYIIMIVLAHFASQVNAQVNFKRFSGGEYGSIVKFSLMENLL